MLGDAPVAAILACTDSERAKKFYGETLGLPQAEFPGAGGEDAPEMMMFQCGQGTMLGVYERPEPTKADHTQAGWMVQDLDAVIDELIARGVRLEVYDLPDTEFDERGVATSGAFRSAWFTDPDGNILSVAQMP